MTNYYFASRFSNHPLMREVRDRLLAEHPESVVTSRWIDLHGGDQDTSVTAEVLSATPEVGVRFCLDDLEDIDMAHVVVSFTGEGGKGGRHIEYGYALGSGKDLVIIGPRENIFHTHPRARWYPTVDAWFASLNDV
jgi:hypothetical protein